MEKSSKKLKTVQKGEYAKNDGGKIYKSKNVQKWRKVQMENCRKMEECKNKTIMMEKCTKKTA